MNIKDRKIVVCTGTNVGEGTSEPGRHEDVSAVKWLEILSQGHKRGNHKRNHWFSTGHFADGGSFSQAVSTGADLVSLDFDGVEGAGDPDSVIDEFLVDLTKKNIAYTAWSSWSHGTKSDPGHSRWRICMVSDRTMLPTEYGVVVDYWVDYFKPYTDVQATRLNTAYGIPLVPKLGGGEWIKTHHDGADCFSVERCLDSQLRKNPMYFTAGESCPVSLTAEEREALIAKKSRASRRQFTGASQRSIVSEEILPADLVLRTLRGDVRASDLSPGENVSSVYSPWRVEKNPSAWAWCTPGGVVYVQDSGSGERRRVADPIWATPEVAHLFYY